MDVIQEGEYIRTWDGIKKIVKINKGKDATYYGKYIVQPHYRNSGSISYKNILKHSSNIIDLIEPRDIINYKGICCNDTIKEEVWLISENNIIRTIDGTAVNINQVESILIKEQFDENKFCI